MTPTRPHRVAVLAFNGCYGAAVFGMTDLLHIANRAARATDHSRTDVFDVSVVAASADPVELVGGTRISADRWHGKSDTLVVPGFELLAAHHIVDKLATWHHEVALVGDASSSGVAIASVCAGAFLAGEAGLLDHRRATTTWLYAAALAARYPAAEITPDSMIVTDGPLTTTAAFSAVNDLALLLIRRHAGPDIARMTARIGLIADNRTSQTPYADHPLVDGGDDSLARSVKEWLVERLDVPYDLHALSEAFHLSTRTMLRRFAADTGQTPLEFLHTVRVQRAKQLLDMPDTTVADVTAAVGYTDPGSFRRVFVRHVGLTPAAYRREFQTGGGTP